MKSIKKLLRVIGLVMLIMLACFGVGLVGGVPIPMNRRKENVIEWRIEQKDPDKNIEEFIFKKQE